MADRDQRYNASAKGKRRTKRAESSEYRKGYRAGYKTGKRAGPCRHHPDSIFRCMECLIEAGEFTASPPT